MRGGLIFVPDPAAIKPDAVLRFRHHRSNGNGSSRIRAISADRARMIFLRARKSAAHRKFFIHLLAVNIRAGFIVFGHKGIQYSGSLFPVRKIPCAVVDKIFQHILRRFGDIISFFVHFRNLYGKIAQKLRRGIEAEGGLQIDVGNPIGPSVLLKRIIAYAETDGTRRIHGRRYAAELQPVFRVGKSAGRHVPDFIRTGKPPQRNIRRSAGKSGISRKRHARKQNTDRQQTAKIGDDGEFFSLLFAHFSLFRPTL